MQTGPTNRKPRWAPKWRRNESWCEFRQEGGAEDSYSSGDYECDERTNHGAKDEGQSPETLGNRVPFASPQEAESKLPNRGQGIKQKLDEKSCNQQDKNSRRASHY